VLVIVISQKGCRLLVTAQARPSEPSHVSYRFIRGELLGMPRFTIG
jgi:hypothetical protein